MGWLVALIVVLIFGWWLLVTFPRYRNTIIGVVIGLVAILAFWIILDMRMHPYR